MFLWICITVACFGFLLHQVHVLGCELSPRLTVFNHFLVNLLSKMTKETESSASHGFGAKNEKYWKVFVSFLKEAKTAEGHLQKARSFEYLELISAESNSASVEKEVLGNENLSKNCEKPIVAAELPRETVCGDEYLVQCSACYDGKSNQPLTPSQSSKNNKLENLGSLEKFTSAKLDRLSPR